MFGGGAAVRGAFAFLAEVNRRIAANPTTMENDLEEWVSSLRIPSMHVW